MSLSTKTIKALEIIRDHPGQRAKSFARLYFTEPKHEYLFTSSCRGANNSTARGKKAWLCAGSLLKCLENRGLLDSYVTTDGAITYHLSDKGQEELKKTKKT